MTCSGGISEWNNECQLYEERITNGTNDNNHCGDMRMHSLLATD